MFVAKGYTLEVTDWVIYFTKWVSYFTKMVLQDQQSAELDIQFVLKKAKFWRLYRDQLNPRQITVIQRMFKEGRTGFESGMSAKKYKRLTGGSKAMALWQRETF